MLLCKIINDNSLYYFFSTEAQSMAALAAILAIFLQYKISSLKNLLVGDGLSIIRRKENDKRDNTQLIYQNMYDTILGRLYDATYRHDLFSIGQVIEYLASEEKRFSRTKEIDLKGFVALFDRFKQAKIDMDKLISLAKWSAVFCLSTLIISLLTIPYIQLLNNYYDLFLVVVVGMLSFFSIVMVAIGLWKGLTIKVYDYEKRGWPYKNN